MDKWARYRKPYTLFTFLERKRAWEKQDHTGVYSAWYSKHRSKLGYATHRRFWWSSGRDWRSWRQQYPNVETDAGRFRAEIFKPERRMSGTTHVNGPESKNLFRLRFNSQDAGRPSSKNVIVDENWDWSVVIGHNFVILHFGTIWRNEAVLIAN